MVIFLAIFIATFGVLPYSYSGVEAQTSGPGVVQGYKILKCSGKCLSSGSVSIDENATASNKKVTFKGKVVVNSAAINGYDIFKKGYDPTDVSPAGPPWTSYVSVIRSPNGSSDWAAVASSTDALGAYNDAAVVNKDGSVSVNIFDNKSSVANPATYQIFLFLQANGHDWTDTSSQVAIPITGQIKYVPAAGSADITLVSATYNQGNGQVLKPDSSGKIDPKLSIVLGGNLADWRGGADPTDSTTYSTSTFTGVCSFTVKQTSVTTNTTYNLLDSGNDCQKPLKKELNGKTLKVSNQKISLPIIIDASNKTSTFVATIEYTSVGNLGSPNKVTTKNLIINYDSKAGIATSDTSAVDSAAGNTSSQDQESAVSNGNNVYDKCTAQLGGEESSNVLEYLGNSAAYNTITKPFCGLMQGIVDLSTSLATYAVTYFLRPALGLS